MIHATSPATVGGPTYERGSGPSPGLPVGTSGPFPRSVLSRPSDPSALGLVSLRIGLGLVWLTNLVFIFDPANQFFSQFSSTASGYAGESLGGSAFPQFVAEHPDLFAGLIAGISVYLAVAFLFGVTTRAAAVIGMAFAAALLVSQFGGTFVIPGGTDVGPMPVYIAAYAALLLGRAERHGSLDAWFGRRAGRSAPASRQVGRGWARPRPVRVAGTTDEAM